MKRVLVFPAYTVAAVNGHAFGAGAQIALAHDARVMRTGRGYFCMPEIDMKAYLHPGMTADHPGTPAAPERARADRHGHALSRRSARSSARSSTARLPEEELLPTALAMAEEWAAKADPVMSVLKRDMYPRVLAALDQKLAPPS